MTPNPIESNIEHDEKIQRNQTHLRGEYFLDEADGEFACGDCGGSCQTRSWDSRHQDYIGECCRLPEVPLLPDHYGEQQVAILEHVVGLAD